MQWFRYFTLLFLCQFPHPRYWDFSSTIPQPGKQLILQMRSENHTRSGNVFVLSAPHSRAQVGTPNENLLPRDAHLIPPLRCSLKNTAQKNPPLRSSLLSHNLAFLQASSKRGPGKWIGSIFNKNSCTSVWGSSRHVKDGPSVTWWETNCWELRRKECMSLNSASKDGFVPLCAGS